MGDIVNFPLHRGGTPKNLIADLPDASEIKDIIVIVTTSEGTQVRMSSMKKKDITWSAAMLNYEVNKMLDEV